MRWTFSAWCSCCYWPKIIYSCIWSSLKNFPHVYIMPLLYFMYCFTMHIAVACVAVVCSGCTSCQCWYLSWCRKVWVRMQLRAASSRWLTLTDCSHWWLHISITTCNVTATQSQMMPMSSSQWVYTLHTEQALISLHALLHLSFWLWCCNVMSMLFNKVK